jgi:hypothetical protein
MLNTTWEGKKNGFGFSASLCQVKKVQLQTSMAMQCMAFSAYDTLEASFPLSAAPERNLH